MHRIDTHDAKRGLTATALLGAMLRPMSKRHLTLAVIALLISALPAMAQNRAAYGQPGSCGYYINTKPR
jgi:hypothetical protein